MDNRLAFLGCAVVIGDKQETPAQEACAHGPPDISPTTFKHNIQNAFYIIFLLDYWT